MAAIGIHVVRVGLFTTDASGVRIDKNSNATTINQLKNTKQEFLVIEDAAIVSSSGYPTIKTYLEREALLGYQLQHLDQSFLITYAR